MNMAGRPLGLDTVDKDFIYKLYEVGFTDSQVADTIGVTEQTINNWKKKDPIFFESVKKKKILADIEVVNALRKRALGYDKDNKHYPAETSALALYLNNRLSQVFRNQKSIDHTTNGKDIQAVTQVERDSAKSEIISDLTDDDE